MRRRGLHLLLAIACGCGAGSAAGPSPPAPAPAPAAPAPAPVDRPGHVTDVAAPRPIVVTGDVVDAAGAPLDGAVVALFDEAAWHVVARTTTDRGRFRFEPTSEATSGTWAVSAHHPAGVGAFVEGLTLSALSDHYDAVIFVEKTTRARPLPAGLRPSKVPEATE